MKKLTAQQIAIFLLFAFPAYAPAAVMLIAVTVWKVSLLHHDILLLMLVIAVIFAAAALLMKKRCFITVPMFVLGGYIAVSLANEQHFGGVLKFYGIWLMLHYLVCFIYMLKKENIRRVTV